MKLFIYSRANAHVPEEILDWGKTTFGKKGCAWVVNDEFADAIEERYARVVPAEHRYSEITSENGCDEAMMISLGGDGTFLEAVHKLRGLPIPIVGVNMGRLGFLAHIAAGDIDKACGDISEGRYNVAKRTMLTVEGEFWPMAPEFPCALNEFTIHRHTADMIDVATYSDGQLLAIIRGDGVIVSTPTGSTAYPMSAGGPIVSPDCACFVCSAIAPHNFSVRPLILPDTSEVSFEIRTRGGEASVSLDNNSFVVGDGTCFKVKKSEYSAFLVELQNISFYDTLRDRMMWGMDRRDNF
jgi:NAD+ kinase